MPDPSNPALEGVQDAAETTEADAGASVPDASETNAATPVVRAVPDATEADAVSSAIEALPDAATAGVVSTALQTMPDATKAGVLTTAMDELGDGATAGVVATALQTLPDAATAGVVTTAMQGLPDAARAGVVTTAMQGLPDAEKAAATTAAMHALSNDAQAEVLDRFAPDQNMTNDIWRWIVRTFAIVLGGAMVALVAAVFVSFWREVDTALVQMLLTIFTTTAGILAGFVSGRASTARTGRA